MVDTNGHVAAGHLIQFGSVLVSGAIFRRVVTTSTDFHNSGYSFNLQPPGGGYRSAEMQTAMRNDYLAGKYQQSPYYLSPPPSPVPGVAGTSRHGFGLAIDVTTNAPVATRNAIMARNGWHLWSSSDPNHFEPNDLNVLLAPPESAFASGGSTPINNTPDAPQPPPKEPEMITLSYTCNNYRNGNWLMAPGFIHGFTAAEWNDWGGWLQSAGVSNYTIDTDARFDSAVSIFTANRFPLAGRGDLSSDAFASLVASKVPASTGTTAAADLTPIANAIMALDSQADTYQTELVNLLKQGTTGTITIPARS